ncbi:MAG: CbiX/SirB N-terminal domain-containing protein [Archaeoglobus sp.]|nr:CbiX/SirB N-terminal domain-containing protein [Archaeoglobus sp.]
MKGLVIAGHGSRSSAFRDVLELHKRRIEKLGLFAEVRIAFVEEGDPPLQKVIEDMKSESIFIVPLFISPGYHVSENIPEIVRKIEDKEIFICDPVGDDIFVSFAIINKIFQLIE